MEMEMEVVLVTMEVLVVAVDAFSSCFVYQKKSLLLQWSGKWMDGFIRFKKN